MKTFKESPCWVVRDADGLPWDEEHDCHHEDEASAEAEIDDIRSEYEDDPSPEERAADLVDSDKVSREDRGARYARALASFQHEVAHLASLHTERLDGICHEITCDRDGCETVPNGDGEFENIHFSDRWPFDPQSEEWTVVGDRHYCEDHSAAPAVAR